MARRGRERRVGWREVRGGLWLISGLAAAAFAVFFLDELRRAVEEGPRLVVVGPAAPDLAAGATVWVAGRPAGRVLSVRFRDDPDPRRAGAIVVEAALHREAAGVLRADASARITQEGVMAPTVLSLDPGSPDRPPFDFGDTLRGSVTLLDQDRTLALLDTLRATMEESRPLARRLRATLAEGDGTWATLRRDSTALRGLERRLRTLDRLLFGGPEGGDGTLGRMLRDTTVATSLEGLAASLDRLAAARESGGAETALRELLETLDGLQGSLLALERDLRRGRGALGRALHDTAILQQTRLLRARTDSLRRELLQHPLRWLRVRLF